MERGFTLVIPLYNKVNCVRMTLDIDNSTCDSIKWNGVYSNSIEWNVNKTNKYYINEIFDSLKQNIENFEYDIELNENNELFLIKKIKINRA